MTKDKILEALKKAGYSAQNTDGVIIVFYTDIKTITSFVEEIRSFMKSKEYDGSWGCRYLKENSHEKSNSIMEDSVATNEK